MDEEAQKIMNNLFGEHTSDTNKKFSEDFPELSEFVEGFALKKVWAREGLSLREKSMVTLSSQIALRNWDQVEKHMHSFINIGGHKKDLKAILLHLTVYCGFPSIVKAFEILKGITNED